MHSSMQNGECSETMETLGCFLLSYGRKWGAVRIRVVGFEEKLDTCFQENDPKRSPQDYPREVDECLHPRDTHLSNPQSRQVLLPAVGKSKGNQRRLHQPTMKRTPKEKCLENHTGPLYVNSLSEMSASLQRNRLVPTYLNSFMSFCTVRKLIFCSLLTPSGQWNSVIKLYFLVSQ